MAQEVTCFPQNPGTCIQIPQHSGTLVQKTVRQTAKMVSSVERPSPKADVEGDRKTSQREPQASTGRAYYVLLNTCAHVHSRIPHMLKRKFYV